MHIRSLYFLSILLLLTISLFAQNKTAPDLLLINGKVWTGNNNPEFVEAIAISGNKIIKIGSSKALKNIADKHTTIIDLKGKLVTPGINDAHIHFLTGSLGLTGVNLLECKTVNEVITTIKKYTEEHPDKKYIVGSGWLYTIFNAGMPNKEDLEKLNVVTKDVPVYLDAYDGHSIWVNSKAMEMAGVTKDTKYEGSGSMIIDAFKEPTGAFTEGAKTLVTKLIPTPSTQEKLDALRAGMKYAASLGITSIQNASGNIEEFNLYETLLKNGELTIRSSTAFSTNDKTTEKDIQQFIEVKNRTKGNNMLKGVAIKFLLDGVIESHTAPMLEPYSDAHADGTNSNSDFRFPLTKYQTLLKRLDKDGFQIYTHAIGDKTVREALNAYELAQTINGTKGKRHRIEHIEQSSPKDIPRFKKLGVMASMEPIHAAPGTIDVWAKAVGEKRLPNSFVWASMLKNKVHLVFSSDWPACITPDPIRGLHNAVNRRTPAGIPAAGWVPEERISLKNALKSYTYEGAYSSFEEKVKGKIQVGYLADIIIYSQDLFTIAPMDIAKTKVVLTIFDGKIIYQNDVLMK
jgi:predicted amidohydrolase YtcJ